MLKNEGNGKYSKYCDWCGRYCSDTSIDTWGHNFCSERCKRAYDNAKGTVDGGYREGSFGYKLHRTGQKIWRVVKIIGYTLLGAFLLLEAIAYFIKK